MSKKNKPNNYADGDSWIQSDSELGTSDESSMDMESIDGSELSIINNKEEEKKIRDKIKGIPLIGRLKRKYQYTITLILAIITFVIAGYSAYMVYSQSSVVKEVKIATGNVGNLLSIAKKASTNYISLNNEELNQLSSVKKDIDKYIAVLRSNENINNGAITTLDNYWKILSQKINTIESSKERLSHNSVIIKNSLTAMDKNIVILTDLIKNTSSRSDMNSYKVIYLTQILSDIQSLYSGVSSLKENDVNYIESLNKINSYNLIISKKIDALIASGLPADVQKSLYIVKEDMIMVSNNINSVSIKVQPIITNISKLKDPGNTNIELATSQIDISVKNFEEKDIFYNYIIMLLSFSLSMLFFTTIFIINSKELNKDLIVSEERLKYLENAILCIVRDVNHIANGDYDRKVRNTTDALMGLKDAINKLVENFVDKFYFIYEAATEFKNDNINYEKHHSVLLEKTNNQSNYKAELKENDKKSSTVMATLKSRNNELISMISSVQPEFNESENNVHLFLETNKETEVKRNIVKSKLSKLEENFVKIKEGLTNLTKLCEFLEALSLNSEIISKKAGSGSHSSFNRIAEDFNAKASDIKTQCNNMMLYVEDAKNDLITINRNNEDIERYNNDMNEHFNVVKKIFQPISEMLTLIKNNQVSFINDNKQIKILSEDNDSLIKNIDESLKQVEGNLAEMKDLNKSNKIKATEVYHNVRFVEQLRKD